MPTLHINITDVLGDTQPGDKLTLWAPHTRPGEGNAVIFPAPATIPLKDGQATVEVAPGPLAIKLPRRGVADAGEKIVNVPDQLTSITLKDILEKQYDYAPPIVGAAQQAAQRAEDAAGDAQGIVDNLPTTIDAALDEQVPPAVAEALAPHQVYTGTGFPNGVVSAPVGSIYTDTAATNGAIKWIKTSGTGNTGWAVEYGDTGWRKIDGPGGEHLQEGEYLVRREGRRLWVALNGAVFRSRNNNQSLGRLPWLFRGTFFAVRFPIFVGLETTPSLSGNISALGYVNIYGTKTDTSATGNVCIATDEAWPTSLPGTPV